MKFILFLSFIALSNLFGCGGCVDYGVPSSLTSSSLSKYASQEQKIHLEIEKLNAIIQNQILKTEKENEILDKQLVEIAKFNNLSKEKINFLMEKQNQIQSIISTIKGEKN